MKIQVITAEKRHLPAIKILWRASSKTLGFFPDGAFDAHLERRLILAALAPNGRIVGYLIYRPARGRVSIAHLCVDENERGKGIARLLMDELKSRTSHLEGILIHCRREYEASKMWGRFGFRAFDEKIGRGRDSAPLTKWWFDFCNTNTLFSERDKRLAETRTLAVLDANVLLGCQDELPESSGLTDGWIENEITLCVVNEMFNEIDRHADPAERKRRRAYASRFHLLNCDSARIETVVNLFNGVLVRKATDSNESDRKHLIQAIAADATFFVTCDEWLLKNRREVEQIATITIVRPSELTIHLDKHLRAANYQPSRFAGSGIEVARPVGKIEDEIWNTFGNGDKGEKKNALLSRVRDACAHPHECTVLTIRDKYPKLKGFVCFNGRDTDCIELSVLRVGHGALSSTIKRHLITDAISRAAKDARPFTVVSDPLLDDESIDALKDAGFVQVDSEWVKLSLQFIGTLEELKTQVENLVRRAKERHQPMLRDVLQRIVATKAGIHSVLDLERQLWPAKITNLDLPCFIVPIRPNWASHLFDPSLANQQLFPVIDHLALNRENVYYRSAVPGIVTAPGRILWYVSHDRRYQGSMRVRACSYLDEVLVDKPSALYDRFERLGVYEWKHLAETVHGDLNKSMMAVRFSGTESFVNPPRFDDIQEILIKHTGKRNQFISPHQISAECFHEIYGRASGSLIEA